VSYPEITFKDFSKLMVKRKLSVDDLVDLFRGKIEDPRDSFERVLSCKYKHEDRSSSVIPYRSVVRNPSSSRKAISATACLDLTLK
jgi:hypothetical protein